MYAPAGQFGRRASGLMVFDGRHDDGWGVRQGIGHTAARSTPAVRWPTIAPYQTPRSRGRPRRGVLRVGVEAQVAAPLALFDPRRLTIATEHSIVHRRTSRRRPGRAVDRT